MKVYWQERKAGQRLLLAADGEEEIEVGAVRKTPRGFDALAKTNTYDPGRAQKGFGTIDEAKEFVESFHPWDIFGGDYDLEVEPEVRPAPSEDAAPAQEQPTAPQASAEDSPVQVEEAPHEPEAVPAEAAQTGPQSSESADPSEEPAPPAPEPEAAPTPAEERPRKRGWLFWRKR